MPKETDMPEAMPLWEQLAVAALIAVSVIGGLIYKRTRKPKDPE